MLRFVNNQFLKGQSNFEKDKQRISLAKGFDSNHRTVYVQQMFFTGLEHNLRQFKHTLYPYSLEFDCHMLVNSPQLDVSWF